MLARTGGAKLHSSSCQKDARITLRSSNRGNCAALGAALAALFAVTIARPPARPARDGGFPPKPTLPLDRLVTMTPLLLTIPADDAWFFGDSLAALIEPTTLGLSDAFAALFQFA